MTAFTKKLRTRHSNQTALVVFAHHVCLMVSCHADYRRNVLLHEAHCGIIRERTDKANKARTDKERLDMKTIHGWGSQIDLRAEDRNRRWFTTHCFALLAFVQGTVFPERHWKYDSCGQSGNMLIEGGGKQKFSIFNNYLIVSGKKQNLKFLLFLLLLF